jgi:hypothetical protein
MANKQDFKDRKRDPNPRNEPPARQVEEQKPKRTRAQDKPERPKAKAAPKQAPPRAVEPDFHDDAELRTETEERDSGRPANSLLRVTDSKSGTIHDEAARLKLRQTAETSPREVVTVEGNPIEVVARPEVLHPVELLPHQRDTVVKDGLRDSGDPEKVAAADASTTTEPPDWHDYVSKVEATSPAGKRDARQPVEGK